MAKAPVMRLTARRTASSRGMVGWWPLVSGRVRTASAVLASEAFDEPTLCDEAAKDGPPDFFAAMFNSSSMRWAMISVSVSETNLWPLAMSAFLRVR